MAIVSLQAKLYQAFHCLVVDKNTTAALSAASTLTCGNVRAAGAKTRLKTTSILSTTMRYATKGGYIKGDRTLQVTSSLTCKFPTYLRIDINKLNLPEGITVNLYVDDDFLRETRETPYTREKYPYQLLNSLARTPTLTFKVPKEFKWNQSSNFSISANNYRPRPFEAYLTGAMNFALNGNYSPAKGVTLVVSPFTQVANAIKTFRPVLALNSASTLNSNSGYLLLSSANLPIVPTLGAINLRVRISAVDAMSVSAAQTTTITKNIGPITANISTQSGLACAPTVLRDFAVPIAPAATTSLSASVQNAMIFKYSSVSGTVKLPFDTRRPFSVYVDWGDGTVTYHENEDGLVSHLYNVPRGQTLVGVWGTAEKIGWESVNVGGVVGSWNCPGIQQLQEYQSWGTLGLENLEYSCANLPNLQNVPPRLPSTIEANGIRYMFYNNQTFNGSNVSQWGSSVAPITKLEGVFYNARAFNQDISGWSVSNVDSFANLFYDARAFNQPLASWNTGNVRFMNYCFYNARSFNQPLTSWNTSKVINFNFMFANAVSFNQYIGDWDVTGEPITGAPNVNMESMFNGADAFNQPLTNWDVSNVWNMRLMFNSADSYNQPMPYWDLSLVTSTYAQFMFNNAVSFNQNLSTWCVPLIASKPSNFDTGATAWTLAKPVWGTCP